MGDQNKPSPTSGGASTPQSESTEGECESVWYIRGPPFNQKEYMISPSESLSVIEDTSLGTVSSSYKSKLGPGDIKIDSKYSIDSGKALEQLVILIQDKKAHVFVDRIKHLVCKFVQGRPSGYHMQDLPGVIAVMEYFARNRTKSAKYSQFVQILLLFAKVPPILSKSSDVLNTKETFSNYFTMFAELLATFTDECFQIHIFEAIDGLLKRRKLLDVASVKLSFCHEAMERSELPHVISTLLETVPCTLYIYYLELALQMILISSRAGHTMIRNNALEFVLRRLDPYSSTGLKASCRQSRDFYENQEARYHYYRLVDKSSCFIWALMMIICKCNIEVPCPGESAVWSLAYAFRREISKGSQKGFDTRNNLAALIVKLFAFFGERLPLLQTGLAVDIAILAVATEIPPEGPWLVDVKIGTNKDDYFLKKLMLISCCLLSKNQITLQTLKNYKVVEGILSFLKPRSTVRWLPSQFVNLFFVALDTLSELAPKLPEVFVHNRGSSRLLNAMTWFMEEHFDRNFLFKCLKSFCTIITSENSGPIIEDVKANDGLKILIDVTFYILDVKEMQVQDQNKLSRMFVILEVLFRDERALQLAYKEACSLIAIKYMQRIIANHENDSKWNAFLHVAFGGFVWEAIAWCPESLKFFIESGGVFLLLDFIQQVDLFPVQMLCLGILVDMTDRGDTISHLLTWRGKDGYGILNMMIEIWRKEEFFTKVGRTKAGLIEDIEAPLMTAEQWYLTHQVRDAHMYSPSIAEMVCSARPKIHALYQFLHKRYFTLTEIGESAYCVQLKNLKNTHKVYIPMIEHYLALKFGEIWFEVIRDMNITGINPTAFDGNVIFTLIDEKNKWGARIKTMQEEMLLLIKAGYAAEEKQIYDFLKSCRLSSTLQALNELDNVARTSNKMFQIQKKQHQIVEVENSLAPYVCTKDLHRTFLETTNVTCMLGNYVWMRSEKEVVKNEGDYNVSSESSDDNEFDTDGEI